MEQGRERGRKGRGVCIYIYICCMRGDQCLMGREGNLGSLLVSTMIIIVRSLL